MDTETGRKDGEMSGFVEKIASTRLVRIVDDPAMVEPNTLDEGLIETASALGDETDGVEPGNDSSEDGVVFGFDQGGARHRLVPGGVGVVDDDRLVVEVIFTELVRTFVRKLRNDSLVEGLSRFKAFAFLRRGVLDELVRLDLQETKRLDVGRQREAVPKKVKSLGKRYKARTSRSRST